MNWDIAVPAITGLVGVVLGATVRPWFEQRLKRQSAQDEREREMIDEWLDMARQKWLFPAMAARHIEQGMVPAEAAAGARVAMKEWLATKSIRWPWETARLRDAPLRQLFEELNEVGNSLVQAMYDVAKTGNPAGYVDLAKQGMNRSEKLRNRIRERARVLGL